MLVPSKQAEVRIGALTAAKRQRSGSDTDDDAKAGETLAPPAALEELHFVVRSLSTHGGSIEGDGSAAAQPGRWRTGTAELSGGQRTLLGLAFGAVHCLNQSASSSGWLRVSEIS
eukprot:COSAG01_NODE_1955_length_8791_cov_6.011474_10_plen_115_part_00